jgi:hypothetical protein
MQEIMVMTKEISEATDRVIPEMMGVASISEVPSVA